MSNTDAVRENLLSGQPMFFPDTGRPFRKSFIQRWYSSMKKNHQRRIRAQEGTHKGQTGSFAWSEEVK